MKSIIIAGIAALALPLSVSAGTILPYLHAQNFCDGMDMGLSSEDATKYAVQEAYIATGNPPYVMHNGRRVQTDVLKALRTAQARCPQHF